MFKISRIVAPVVFSENCRGALYYAVSLASHFKSELTVLHILEWMRPSDFDTDIELEYLEKARRKWVHREFLNLSSGLRGRVPIQEVCVDGDPAREIVRYSDASNADLVVMASRGHGPFRRFLLGSVTAKVLHDARCAVWTGAHLEQALTPDAATDRFNAVLCAVDFGPQTEAAIEWSSGMAKDYGAKLTLLHVIPRERDPERQREAREDAMRRLENRRDLLHVEADGHTAIGDVILEVNKSARRTNADLLVIGRGRLKAGGRLRSTSYALLRESPCPVVSV
jgi:nucleotide-binding universal stress UspA family protein